MQLQKEKKKKADALFKSFDETVLLVEPDNIVQFITGNVATYKAANKKKKKKSNVHE